MGRVMFLTFDRYPDRFDEIHEVFGKEAVWQGSFDRYVQDTKRKRGTSEVDAEFQRTLTDYMGWENYDLRIDEVSGVDLSAGETLRIDREVLADIREVYAEGRYR